MIWTDLRGSFDGKSGGRTVAFVGPSRLTPGRWAWKVTGIPSPYGGPTSGEADTADAARAAAEDCWQGLIGYFGLIERTAPAPRYGRQITAMRQALQGIANLAARHSEDEGKRLLAIEKRAHQGLEAKF